jgi:hypothetical protein
VLREAAVRRWAGGAGAGSPASRPTVRHRTGRRPARWYPAARRLAWAAATILGALAGCTGEDRLAPGEPHARLTCAACHQGGRADVGRAAVPTSACAGCHRDHGPAVVRLASASFPHRDHGAWGDVVASCAGCHTHDRGAEPLRASVDACALCHAPQMSDGDAQHCAQCHGAPGRIQLTSQGVAVAHAALPVLTVGCTRCHYDVADPPTGVPLARCAACHTRLADATAAGIAENLHPVHSGLTCTACHDAGAHHIRAMSSVVALVCADCHQTAHELDTRGGWPSSRVCADCHGGIHAAQQQLFLGLVPFGPARPSSKFVAGMSCRSCHVPPAGAATGVSGPDPVPYTIRGTAEACAGCHLPEYATVLRWWLTGVEQRAAATDAYVARAERALSTTSPVTPAADSARALLAGARALLSLVREAGGHHNVELSDRLFRESLARSELAYRVLRRTPPPAPALGTPPHMGLCTGCHYDPTGPRELGRMDDALHRSFMR